MVNGIFSVPKSEVAPQVSVLFVWSLRFAVGYLSASFHHSVSRNSWDRCVWWGCFDWILSLEQKQWLLLSSSLWEVNRCFISYKRHKVKPILDQKNGEVYTKQKKSVVRVGFFFVCLFFRGNHINYLSKPNVLYNFRSYNYRSFILQIHVNQMHNILGMMVKKKCMAEKKTYKCLNGIVFWINWVLNEFFFLRVVVLFLFSKQFPASEMMYMSHAWGNVRGRLVLPSLLLNWNS